MTQEAPEARFTRPLPKVTQAAHIRWGEAGQLPAGQGVPGTQPL